MRKPVLAVLFAVAALVLAQRAPAEKVKFRDRERIVFYGDSITQQNLYTAYLETFLITRLPGKNLEIYNFGWGGDTARGGAGRFERDAGSVRPTLVFVNFGMNDGKYSPYEDWIGEGYVSAQKRLCEEVKRKGARLVWFTASPVDCRGKEAPGWCPGYNETLRRLSESLKVLGTEKGVPVISLFEPMLAIQEEAKKRDPAFTFVPDRIHPDEKGHLVMAYLALKEMDVPSGGGTLVLGAGDAERDGAMKAENVRRAGGRIEFDLRMPFIPFYVPEAAKSALNLVPFEPEFNKFVIRVPGWDPAVDCEIFVEGRRSAVVSGGKLAEGVDLSGMEGADWGIRGRAVWEIAQVRWKKHYEAWREMELGAASPLKEGQRFVSLVRAQKDYVAELGRVMRRLSRGPRSYRVALVEKGARGFARLLEGWDEAWCYRWNTWDGTVSASSSREPVTQGEGALRLDFDLSSYEWPSVYAKLAPVEDFTDARAVAVDVWVPRGMLRQDEKLRAGVKLDGLESWGDPPLKAGGWNELVFEFEKPEWKAREGEKRSLGPEDLGKVSNIAVVLGAEGGKPRGRVIIDNLRLVR